MVWHGVIRCRFLPNPESGGDNVLLPRITIGPLGWLISPFLWRRRSGVFPGALGLAGPQFLAGLGQLLDTITFRHQRVAGEDRSDRRDPDTQGMKERAAFHGLLSTARPEVALRVR